MKRRVKSIQRMANQLTDPKPEFVSLVGHGANQTPYRALKSDIFDARSENQEDEMTKQAEIQKITFSTSKFESAEKVESWLEAKGYSDFKVEKTRKGFEVVAKGEGDFSSELKTIQLDEGVMAYVGKLAEGAEPLETVNEQKAEKVFKAGELSADEVVKKYHDYCCGPSVYVPPVGKTVADVLSEQYSSGSFPAFWDLNNAFSTALFNLVKEGETAKVKALATEYGDLIVAILTALSTAGVDTTAVKAHFEQPEKEKTMTVEKKDAPAGAAEAKDEKATKSDAPAADGAEKKAEGEQAPADKANAPAEKQDSGEKAEKADAPDAAALMVKAISDAVSPLTKALADLTAGMAELQKATKDSLAELDSKVSKTGERVSELEGARQTRKSADDNGSAHDGTQRSEPETEQTKAQKAYDDRMVRSRMGFMS